MTVADRALPPPVVEARIVSALKSILGTFDGSLEPVRRGVGSHAVAQAYPPLPVSAHVLDVRLTTCARLTTWSRVVLAGRKLKGVRLRANDVPALTHFLTIHARWLSTLDSGEAVMAQMESSASDLAAISTFATDDSTFLGNCPIEVEIDGLLRVCAGQVRSSGGTGICARCGMSGDTPWWEHRMFPEASRFVTARDLVREIHQQRGQRVSEVTIRVWLTRGIIVSVGLDDQGRRLYDKGAVAKALATADSA